MSARASTSGEAIICSGDMYWGEPTVARGWVRRKLPLWAASLSLEMPKSSTFTSGVPSGRRVRNRLAGLRSRWTIPLAWASASPSQACRT